MLEHDGDIAVAGHCPEAARVTGAVSRVAPDLVVIGPDLPDEDRRAAVEEIMATAPRPVLVLLSRRQEPPAWPPAPWRPPGRRSCTGSTRPGMPGAPSAPG